MGLNEPLSLELGNNSRWVENCYCITDTEITIIHPLYKDSSVLLVTVMAVLVKTFFIASEKQVLSEGCC